MHMVWLVDWTELQLTENGGVRVRVGRKRSCKVAIMRDQIDSHYWSIIQSKVANLSARRKARVFASTSCRNSDAIQRLMCSVVVGIQFRVSRTEGDLCPAAVLAAAAA